MVVNNMLLIDRQSRMDLGALDGSLPAHGPVHDRLQEIVSDQPLSQFVLGELYSRLREIPWEEGSKSLSEIPSFSDLPSVANDLIDGFSALPRHYIFSLSLPDIFTDAVAPDNHLPFSKTIAIRGGGDVMKEWLPLTTGNERKDRAIFGQGILAIAIPQTWDGAFLQIKSRGFTAPFVDVAIDHRIVETVKSFFGLWVAHNVIERRFAYSPVVARRKIRVHSFDRKWELAHQLELDEVTSRLISDLHFYDFKGQFASENFKRALLTQIGAEVAKAFEPSADAERVRLAARWLFDSYANDDELMAFLQAMVVLEIVLGDKATSEKIGLNELLRNRCAYLIGDSAEERSEIMEQFSLIYDVRSQIVHRGKSRISARERALFHTLRSYCKRVIQQELKLLPEAPGYMKAAEKAADEQEAVDQRSLFAVSRAEKAGEKKP